MLSRKFSQACKGFAIISVILCHAAGKFGQGNFTLFTPLGCIGASVFLLLSAYGLNESWREGVSGTKREQHWWTKRFVTVWIPYIIVQLTAYWPFHRFQAIPFLFDLSLLRPLYHNGWYLQYLFMWYVIFYTVRRIQVLDNHRQYVSAVISILLFLALREIKAEQSMSFLFGIFLSEEKERQNKLLRYDMVWPLCFLALPVLP